MLINRRLSTVAINAAAVELFLGALGIAAAAWYASNISITSGDVIALWPSAGIALWLCWHHSMKAAIPICAAYALVGMINWGEPRLAAAVGNTLGSLMGGWLLRRYEAKFDQKPMLVVAWLIGVAGGVSAAISVLFGATELSLRLALDIKESAEVAVRWFMSCFAGVLIAAPPMFVWSDVANRKLPNFGSTELMVATSSCVAMLLAMSVEAPFIRLEGLLLLICLPAIFWIAMRDFGLESTVGLSIIGACNLTFSTMVLSTSSKDMLENQLFVMSFMAVALVLQAAMAQRSDLVRKLRQQSAQLEERVRKRTHEAKQAQLRAELADRSKSEFLANTSHEVRTPLNAILGMAEFLRDSELSEDQQNHVDTILLSGRHLLSLLNDVIDLSKVEAGKFEISAAPDRLDRLTHQLTNLWQPMAHEKGIGLDINAEKDVPQYLLLDSLRLLQCLSNLVSNAVKFTSVGRVAVQISAIQQSKNELTLSFAVSDTGIGISDEEQSRLFQPFQQVDASIARKYGGTGLGLSITRKLANLMGGDVTIDSEKNVGTTFTLTIAARVASADQRQNSTSPKTQQVAELPLGLKVLLVEDNHVNRLVVKGHLKAYAISFVDAENGLEALEILSQQSFDLVLLDIQMPVLDGIETFKQLRANPEKYASVPIVALTANAMVEERERLLKLGMQGYATKPIDREALVQEMCRVLAK